MVLLNRSDDLCVMQFVCFCRKITYSVAIVNMCLLQCVCNGKINLGSNSWVNYGHFDMSVFEKCENSAAARMFHIKVAFAG